MEELIISSPKGVRVNADGWYLHKAHLTLLRPGRTSPFAYVCIYIASSFKLASKLPPPLL